MKFLYAAFLVVATAGVAMADGPFSHTSNSVTQPIIQYDSAGNIIYIECIPGSRCALHTGTTALSSTATQTIRFILTTSSTVSTDHFAFGVRGNATNGPCDAPSKLLANPFWGRGIIIYPGAQRIKFENFTMNCRPVSAGNPPSGGVVESTSRSIQFLPNTTYIITVWANGANVGYDITKRLYNAGDGSWDIVPVATGDCLSQASAADDFKCAKRPEDQASANRTFVASVTDLYWTVTKWFIY